MVFEWSGALVRLHITSYVGGGAYEDARVWVRADQLVQRCRQRPRLARARRTLPTKLSVSQHSRSSSRVEVD